MIRIFLILFCYAIRPGLADKNQNFFMLVQRNGTHMNVTCVATEETSNWGLSLVRINRDKSKFNRAASDNGSEISVFKIPGEDRPKFFYINKEESKLEKTMGFPLPMILDSRWNDFVIHQGPNVSKVNVTGSGIYFSLLGSSLKIILSGSIQITITINGKVVTLNDGTEKVNKIIFDAHRNFEWNHFLISWTGKVFHLSSITDPKILTYHHHSVINCTTATFEATDNSVWTVHEHTWWDARKLTFIPEKDEHCLVLYLAACKTCTMTLQRGNKTEAITGFEGKWIKKKLTNLSESRVIAVTGIENRKSGVEQYFAVNFRKCPLEPEIKTISQTFPFGSIVKCFSFDNTTSTVISYGNTTIGLMKPTKLNNYLSKINLNVNNRTGLVICNGRNKCYFSQDICESSHSQVQERNVNDINKHKFGVQIYCHLMDDNNKTHPFKALVRWRTTPPVNGISYSFFRFCEKESPDVCEKVLPAKQCNIRTWSNYSCSSSSNLKEGFEYNLLAYKKDPMRESTFIPVECNTFTASDKEKFDLNVTESTKNGILTLTVCNSWNDLVTTELRLISKNDNNDVHYDQETTGKEHPVYKLTNAKYSTTYRAILYVQTEQECTISNEIEVHTPPDKSTLGKTAFLNCMNLTCTIELDKPWRESKNTSLYVFKTDDFNKDTWNEVVNDSMVFGKCKEMYDTDTKRWASYKMPSNVIAFKNHENGTNTAGEHTITFKVENSEVSVYKIKMLFIDTYYDKITCTLFSINTKESAQRKVTLDASQGDEGVDVIIIVGSVLFSLGMFAVIASITVYKKKLGTRLFTYVNARQDNNHVNNVKPPTRLVRVDDLEEYVKQALKVVGEGQDELTRQFKLCRSGQTQPWDYGRLPENNKKHRYKNIVAYDHSRVVLSKLPDDDFSDYINANYVGDGEYIATQGPKKNTTNDFWRMVWEQNCPVIIMLTKFVEDDKPKCEKYWPDESEDYGEITVSLTSQQYLADYWIRTFNLCRENANKQVTHLHYELWPDHGVSDCQSLALFIAAIPPPSSTGPQIVHCSAGCGRTGTLILAQICLKSARQMGQVDFLNALAAIRKNRVDLVQTEKQYKVTHLLVLEILFKEDYTVACDGNTKSAIANRKAVAEQQVRYLEKVSWRDTALFRSSVSMGNDKDNLIKNRFATIIPSAHSSVIIPRYPLTDAYSDYINAVLIRKFYNSVLGQNFDGVEADYANTPELYSSADFIVTQQPLPNTTGDFWRMVLDKQAEVIISLNQIDSRDQSSVVFWPLNEEEISPTPDCKLEFTRRISNHEAYDVLMLHATEDNASRNIMLISMTNWKPGETVPSSASHLLELVKHVQTLSPGQVASEKPIIVTCYDGATASGLFLSLVTALEMVRIENKFDLSRVVRTIRQSRTEFMRKIEQLQFLYDAISDYLDNQPAAHQPVIYSNMGPVYSNLNDI